jgi:DNA polymerase III epsilon subunit-like protein
MTCIVNNGLHLHSDTVFIVYDLEAVGDARTPAQCKIWNLAAIHYVSGAEYSVFVDPQSKEDEYPMPPHPDLFRVTKAFLKNKKARPFKTIGSEFFNWVTAFHVSTEAPVVLISHGNFMLDKPLLEYEFGRDGIALPHNWYFYDTLPWFRAQMRKEPSYSMKNLYKSVFMEAIPQQHFALPDAQALYRLLKHTVSEDRTSLNRTLYGVYYPPYYTPLQRVKFLGTYNEMLLVQGGVQSVEDLHMILLQHCNLDLSLMQRVLMNRFYIKEDSAYKISNSVLHMLLIPKP